VANLNFFLLQFISAQKFSLRTHLCIEVCEQGIAQLNEVDRCLQKDDFPESWRHKEILTSTARLREYEEMGCKELLLFTMTRLVSVVGDPFYMNASRVNLGRAACIF
jgi:hypothetical protein